MDMSTPALEQIRVAVLRLKGMVGEASTLAAQLASARRHRLLCVDRHRRRQLPPLPTTNQPTRDDLHRFPASVLQLSTTNSETLSTPGTSRLESHPTVDEDAYFRDPSTSTVSDLMAVRFQCNPVDFPRVIGMQPEQRLDQVLVSEADVDWRTDDMDTDQRLLIEQPRSAVVENDQRSGTILDTDYAVTAITDVTHNLEPRHSLTVTPRYRRAIAYLLHTARERTPFRRVHCIINGLNHDKEGSPTAGHRRTTSRLVAVVLIAAVFLCLAFLSCYESSRMRTNSGYRWPAVLLNTFGMHRLVPRISPGV